LATISLHVVLSPGRHSSQGGHGHPKFLSHLVILCFERRYPKQDTVARLKSKFWAGYAAVHATSAPLENEHVGQM